MGQTRECKLGTREEGGPSGYPDNGAMAISKLVGRMASAAE